MTSRLLLATTSLFLAAAPSAWANSILNGGFETLSAGGGFANWSITGASVVPDAVFPNTGNYDAAFTDFVGAKSVSVLSQSVVTQPSAGYTLTFALMDESGLSNDKLTVAFGGFQATVSGDKAGPPGTLPSFYTAFSFAIPAVNVSATTTTLSFSGVVDPTNGTAFNLDDVALVAGSAPPTPSVPEPSSLVLFASGAIGILIIGRIFVRRS